MKMERKHLVPLASQVVTLLEELREGAPGEFVFPGYKPGHPISQNTMIYGCYRVGDRGRQTVHGFRGSLRRVRTRPNAIDRTGWRWLSLILTGTRSVLLTIMHCTSRHGVACLPLGPIL